MQKDNLHSFIKDTMKKNNLRFTKSLGQNFLKDENVLDDIIDIADVSKEDYILEIGPGLGVLTKRIAQAAKKVVAVEIDKHIIETLKSELAAFDNVEIINKDILKVDINQIKEEYFGGNEFKVVANLPYYITTPIIMKILESRVKISSLVVMVQKEVAERLVATSGKEYGAISVAVQYYGKPTIGRIVSAGCFIPAPKVDSAVIRVDIYKQPPVQISSEEIFFKVVRFAFNQRRKTLLNALSQGTFVDGDKEKLRNIIEECNLDANIRGEKLSIQDFANISNKLYSN